jgi:hypothetical protein
VFAYLGISSAIEHRSMAGRPLLVVAALLVLTGVQLLVVGLIAEMINNLERSNVGRSKIAQVLRVDRRSSLVLAPGVQVERRQGVRGAVPGGAATPVASPGMAAPGSHAPTVVVDRRRSASAMRADESA